MHMIESGMLDNINSLNAGTVLVDKPNADKIYIADAADIHGGSLHCNKEALEYFVSSVFHTKDFYVIIGGDSMEHATKSSPGSAAEEETHGMDQILMVSRMLRPIRDRILFVRSGNHGRTRALRNNTPDPEHMLAEIMGVPYKTGFAAVTAVVGPHTYVLGTSHTSKKPTALSYIPVDVMFHEHTHEKGTSTTKNLEFSAVMRSWTVQERVEVHAGSYLQWDGYAQENMYKPHFTGTPVVELHGDTSSKYIRRFETTYDFNRVVHPETLN